MGFIGFYRLCGFCGFCGACVAPPPVNSPVELEDAVLVVLDSAISIDAIRNLRIIDDERQRALVHNRLRARSGAIYNCDNFWWLQPPHMRSCTLVVVDAQYIDSLGQGAFFKRFSSAFTTLCCLGYMESTSGNSTI